MKRQMKFHIPQKTGLDKTEVDGDVFYGMEKKQLWKKQKQKQKQKQKLPYSFSCMIQIYRNPRVWKVI